MVFAPFAADTARVQVPAVMMVAAAQTAATIFLALVIVVLLFSGRVFVPFFGTFTLYRKIIKSKSADLSNHCKMISVYKNSAYSNEYTLFYLLICQD